MHGQFVRNRHSVGWKYRAPHKKRLFKPNLQTVRMLVNGATKRTKVCTKCMKSGRVLKGL